MWVQESSRGRRRRYRRQRSGRQRMNTRRWWEANARRVLMRMLIKGLKKKYRLKKAREQQHRRYQLYARRDWYRRYTRGGW